MKLKHCVKSVCFWSFSGPYFLVFTLNTERYVVSLRIQLEYGKIWIRKTPNTDTFDAVNSIHLVRTPSFPKIYRFLLPDAHAYLLASKAFIKPFVAPQTSVKIKI